MVRTPLWISHHPPEQYDRCTPIAGLHVCRRCLLLWPLTFVALVVIALIPGWPRWLDAVLYIVLPLPAVVEFVGEHAALLPYRPRLQRLVTPPLAVGLAAGFDRYVASRGDPVFWVVAAAYGGACAGSVLVASRRPAA